MANMQNASNTPSPEAGAGIKDWFHTARNWQNVYCDEQLQLKINKDTREGSFLKKCSMGCKKIKKPFGLSLLWTVNKRRFTTAPLCHHFSAEINSHHHPAKWKGKNILKFAAEAGILSKFLEFLPFLISTSEFFKCSSCAHLKRTTQISQ